MASAQRAAGHNGSGERVGCTEPVQVSGDVLCRSLYGQLRPLSLGPLQGHLVEDDVTVEFTEHEVGHGILDREQQESRQPNDRKLGQCVATVVKQQGARATALSKTPDVSTHEAVDEIQPVLTGDGDETGVDLGVEHDPVYHAGNCPAD